MKKMIFVLTALLLATPAMANVTISCSQQGDPGQGYELVEISYVATEDSNLPRGFGLEVVVDSGVTITGVESSNTDYWVYPGSIVIDTNDPPEVVNEGTPIASGQGTSSAILEMGSLHSPTGPSGANSPALSGVLITLQLSGTDCNVTVSGNGTRGNVVNYAADQADTAYGAPCYIAPACWTGAGADWTEWDTVGRPTCWCNPRQCHGDADGTKEGRFNYWTAIEDLAVLKAAWSKSYANIAGQVWDHGTYTTPLICADFDRLYEGRFQYRVAVEDLGILKKHWSKANLPDPNCVDIVGNQE